MLLRWSEKNNLYNFFEGEGEGEGVSDVIQSPVVTIKYQLEIVGKPKTCLFGLDTSPAEIYKGL